MNIFWNIGGVTAIFTFFPVGFPPNLMLTGCPADIIINVYFECLWELKKKNWSDLGVSKNRDTAKWMVKIMETPIKMDDLGGNPTIFGNIHLISLSCAHQTGVGCITSRHHGHPPEVWHAHQRAGDVARAGKWLPVWSWRCKKMWKMLPGDLFHVLFLFRCLYICIYTSKDICIYIYLLDIRIFVYIYKEEKRE